MNKKVTDTVSIEHAHLLFLNFAGKESQYNSNGNRNFCVLLEDPEVVQRMIDDGWNVRYLRPLEPDLEPQPYIQVKVAFGQYPPKIVLITSRGMTAIGEEDVAMLDTAEIANADLIFRPYNWSMPSGKSGVKAYLKALYITLAEDEFEKKYAAMESSSVHAMMDQSDLPF